MTTIYTPTQTAAILAAIGAILLANNGHADIGTDAAVIAGVEAAGFVVIASKTLHGAPTFRGFTKAAQAALAVSPFGVSTYAAPSRRVELPDYEAAILARQDRAGELA